MREKSVTGTFLMSMDSADELIAEFGLSEASASLVLARVLAGDYSTPAPVREGSAEALGVADWDIDQVCSSHAHNVGYLWAMRSVSSCAACVSLRCFCIRIR